MRPFNSILSGPPSQYRSRQNGVVEASTYSFGEVERAGRHRGRGPVARDLHPARWRDPEVPLLAGELLVNPESPVPRLRGRIRHRRTRPRPRGRSGERAQAVAAVCDDVFSDVAADPIAPRSDRSRCAWSEPTRTLRGEIVVAEGGAQRRGRASEPVAFTLRARTRKRRDYAELGAVL